MDVKATSSLELPEAFLDPSIYTASDTTPRYIRLKPGCEVYLEEIETEIKCKLEKLAWLPNFYYFPPQIQIANSKAYREGKIYGIDAASGAAVTALDICLGDHVLDLCAAPGAKLCMISDLLGSSGSVTGAMSQDRDWQLVQLCCRNMHLEINVVCLLLMEQHFPLFLTVRESALEEKLAMYKEWTSRRPWKERKTANKARKIGKLLLVPQFKTQSLYFLGCILEGSVRGSYITMQMAVRFHTPALTRSLWMQNDT